MAFATVMMSAVGYFLPVFNGRSQIPGYCCQCDPVVTNLISESWLSRAPKRDDYGLQVNSTLSLLFLPFSYLRAMLTAHFWTNVIVITKDWNNCEPNQTVLHYMMWVFVELKGPPCCRHGSKDRRCGESDTDWFSWFINDLCFGVSLALWLLQSSGISNYSSTAMVYLFKEIFGPWGGLISLA